METAAIDVEVEAVHHHLAVGGDKVGYDSGIGGHLSREGHREELVSRVHL